MIGAVTTQVPLGAGMPVHEELSVAVFAGDLSLRFLE